MQNDLNGKKFQSITASILILYAALFAVLSNWSYFRHDDWLLIGNGIIAATKNPSMLLKGSLYTLGVETAWFFRPLSLLMAYSQFFLFGYHYSYWVFSYILMLVLAVIFGQKAILNLGGTSSQSCLFAVLVCASLQWHIGSVLWVGEGAMNCPQVLLLMLAFYFFSLSLKEKTRFLFPLTVACFFFTLSLGFKESSIFLLPLLAAILWHQKKLQKHWKQTSFLGAITFFYLIFRFTFIKMNEGYYPALTTEGIVKPAATLFISLSFSILILWISNVSLL